MDPILLIAFGIVAYLLLSSDDNEKSARQAQSEEKRKNGGSQVLAHDGGSRRNIRATGLERSGVANGIKPHRPRVRKPVVTEKEIHHHHYHEKESVKENRENRQETETKGEDAK